MMPKKAPASGTADRILKGLSVLAFRRFGTQTSSFFGVLPYLSGPLPRIRMPGASPLVNSMPAASSADWMDARLEP